MEGEWCYLMLFVTTDVRLVMGELLYIWGQIDADSMSCEYQPCSVENPKLGGTIIIMNVGPEGNSSLRALDGIWEAVSNDIE